MPTGRFGNEWNTSADDINILGENINTIRKIQKFC
jgi:hypothetical protein